MIVSGRIVKGHKTIYRKSIADTCPRPSDFHDKLENCLLALCRDADIPAPMWLAKNTAELARFNKAVFYAEQFAETVGFDRFEIKIEET